MYENEIEAVRPRLLSKARRDLGMDDADDAVQETLCRFYCSGKYDEERGDVVGYLWGILEKVIVDMLRLRERDYVVLERLAERVEEEPASHHNPLALARIDDASLSDDERTAIRLRAEGETYEAIGQALGKGERMARYYVSRARKKLSSLRIELGYSSAEEMFQDCSQNTIYRKPTSTGSFVSRARLGRTK